MKELTIEEVGNLWVPFNLCLNLNKQYYLDQDETCQVNTQKNMQQLTQENYWEEVELNTIIYPYCHEVIIKNEKILPIDEFHNAIVDLLHLKSITPYMRIIIYHVKLPMASVLVDGEKRVDYKEMINYKSFKERGEKKREYSILACFYALRVIDKEGYIKQLRDKIKELDEEISDIEKS